MFIKLTIMSDEGEEPSLVNLDEVKRICIDAEAGRPTVVWKSQAKDTGNHYDFIKEDMKEVSIRLKAANLFNVPPVVAEPVK
jgi:hypothetical protein